MKDSFFLICTKDGVRRIAKGRRSQWDKVKLPALSAGEYATYLHVEIPDSTFAPRPTAEATIRIPESAVVAPPVEVEVLEPPVADDEVAE
jgi:hypothetical protein